VIRALWEEVRPISGAALPLVNAALQTRYGFTNAGISAVAQQAGLSIPMLQFGSMVDGHGSFPVNSIEFQPHLLVAVCSTTDDAIVFINDMFKFLAESFGFRVPSEERPRYYRSTIIVDSSGIELDDTIGRWNEILGFINSRASEGGTPYKALGIRFTRGDFNIVGDGIPTSTPFVLERRLGAPPGENWWFSQAPVDTPTHVAILETIGQTFL